MPVSDRGAGGHGKQNQPDKKKTKKTDYTSSNGNQATQAAAELTAVAPLLSQDNKTVATQSQWRLAAAVVRSTHRPSPPYTAPPPPPLPLCYLSVVELKPYTSCHAVALDRQAGRYRRPRTSSHFGTTNRPRHQVGPEHAAAAARCPPTARWNNPTPFIRVRLQLHLSSLCASAVAVLCRYDTAAAGGACQAWKFLGDCTKANDVNFSFFFFPLLLLSLYDICLLFVCLFIFYILFYFMFHLFERSEFLIATCKETKTDRLCVRMFG